MKNFKNSTRAKIILVLLVMLLVCLLLFYLLDNSVSFYNAINAVLNKATSNYEKTGEYSVKIVAKRVNAFTELKIGFLSSAILALLGVAFATEWAIRGFKKTISLCNEIRKPMDD